MPKRMNTKKRLKLMDAIIQRDGDACLLCQKAPVRDKTIDHLDGNIRHDRLDNLNLLCRRCNTAEGNRARTGCRWLTAETLSAYRARLPKNHLHGSLVTKGEREGERGRRVPPKPPPNRWTGYDRDGEASSGLMDAYFRLWLFRLVGGQGEVTEEEAVNSGAEFLDQQVGRGNPKTTVRYFRKVTSSQGWLLELRTSSGQSVWCLRKDVNPQALEAELERRVIENGGTLEFKKSWLKNEGEH